MRIQVLTPSTMWNLLTLHWGTDFFLFCSHQNVYTSFPNTKLKDQNTNLTAKAHFMVCNTSSYSIATQLGKVAYLQRCHWYHSLLKKASGSDSPLLLPQVFGRNQLMLKQQLLNWNWEQKSSYWKGNITILRIGNILVC